MEAAIQKLVETGILGVIIFFLGVTVSYLFKLLIAEKDKNNDLLRETLQRDDEHFKTMETALRFIKDVSDKS